jgi:hypothetical protein
MTQMNDENRKQTQDDLALTPFEEQLADFLAGEMTQPQQDAFEARLRTDPGLAEKAGRLAGVQSVVLKAMPSPTGTGDPGSDRQPTSATSLSPDKAVLGRIGRAALSYAAIFLVAFGAGMWTNAWLESPGHDGVVISTGHTSLARIPEGLRSESTFDMPSTADELQSLAQLKVSSGLVQNLTSLATR